MKTLVVYYSRDGLTKKIGDSVADLLKADAEEIFDKTDRSGFWGWLFGGRDAFRKKLTVIGGPKNDPAAYDLVVIGSPIWAGRMTPAVRTYLLQNSAKFNQTAFFCTKGNSPTKNYFTELAQLTGKKPLAELDIKKGEEKTGIATHKMIQFVEEVKRALA